MCSGGEAIWIGAAGTVSLFVGSSEAPFSWTYICEYSCRIGVRRVKRRTISPKSCGPKHIKREKANFNRKKNDILFLLKTSTTTPSRGKQQKQEGIPRNSIQARIVHKQSVGSGTIQSRLQKRQMQPCRASRRCVSQTKKNSNKNSSNAGPIQIIIPSIPIPEKSCWKKCGVCLAKEMGWGGREKATKIEWHIEVCACVVYQKESKCRTVQWR